MHEKSILVFFFCQNSDKITDNLNIYHKCFFLNTKVCKNNGILRIGNIAFFSKCFLWTGVATKGHLQL